MAAAVASEIGTTVDYHVGTMIELPRAALLADESPRRAEFFSFGTNDLTQTDARLLARRRGKFLGAYVQKGIFANDPFVSLDRDGVGELVAHRARARPRGRGPTSSSASAASTAAIRPRSRSSSEVGLDYVSCSPFRVPIARLAAAQAALGGKVASQA